MGPTELVFDRKEAKHIDIWVQIRKYYLWSLNLNVNYDLGMLVDWIARVLKEKLFDLNIHFLKKKIII